MKKLIALIILGLLGFYVAWPAWSGYKLATALRDGDAAGLESKIDFPSVRQSLRPTVTVEVEKAIAKQGSQGLGQLLTGDLKAQMMPKLVDAVLEKVVTPINVIRIAKEGGNVAGTVEKIMMEEMGKVGGIPGLKLPGGAGGLPNLPGGLGTIAGAGAAATQLGIPGIPGLPGMGGGQPPASAPAPAAPAAPKAADSTSKPASFGLGNIKSFGLDGPLGYSVSVAKDAAAGKPDLTAGMRFTGMDWKLTSVVPHL